MSSGNHTSGAMLSILDRYIGKTLLGMVVSVLLVLLSIMTVFTLVDELRHTGHGNYSTLQAMQYVLLTVPKLSYGLLPIVTLIGSMAALGMLANSSELAVIRTSGISQLRLALSFGKTSLLLIFICFAIGEFIVPAAEQKAKYIRSVAMSNQIILRTKNGLWTRDNNSFINIKNILPGNKISEVYIYEFDDTNQLRTGTHAQTAEYLDDRWILYDLEQMSLQKNHIKNLSMKSAAWDTILTPETINLLTIKPQYMSIWRLSDYIDYFQRSGQNSKQYEQALWSKIITPFSILIMSLLALVFVKTGSRTVPIRQHIFVGVLAGIVYHIISQISGSLGIVYGMMPFFSVALPPMLLSLFIIFRLKQAG